MSARETGNELRRLYYAPGLDGLRALSVAGVIAFHAESALLPGGFLGVEVFFVLSGYLITSLLLSEIDRTGGIWLPAFWLARARRLLPALFAVLAVTLVLARALTPDSWPQTRGDALAALAYSSNWWQLAQQRSYFMAVERPPLLQHLWSLAVEEQFYIFWPLAVTLIGRSGRRWLPAVAVTAAAVSVWSLVQRFDPQADATRLYVGTDTRASGLLLGAALAGVFPLTATPYAQENPVLRVGNELSGALGLVALVWAFSQIGAHDALLYRGGLVFVDFAVCALIVGLVNDTCVARCLGARPFSWIGKRSYGLYLWHWPVFVLTRPEFDLDWSNEQILLLRLAFTFALSEACYWLIETPVRRGALTALFARCRNRSVAMRAGAALLAAGIAGLVCLSGSRLAAANLPSTRPLASRAMPSGPALAAQTQLTVADPIGQPGIPPDPAWPKTLTLLTDSVALSLSESLPLALPGWKVEVLGRPALMVKQAVPEFLRARPVGSVVVIGLAYNSLFERDRKNYERWSALWDRNAERLVSDLKACGAKKLVWITLREPAPELVTAAGRDQYDQYAWFFPYVNERIRALGSRHPELALADWRAVSNVPDITNDLIHLNEAGVRLMTQTVTAAVLGAASNHGE